MRSPTLIIAAAILMGSLLPTNSGAALDDVRGWSKQAIDSYEGGDFAAAIELWQKCIGDAQSQGADDLAGRMPGAPADFDCGELDSQSGNWGSGEGNMQWTQVERRCTRTADDAVLHMVLTDSPQAFQGVEAMAQMLDNEQMVRMMNMDPEQSFEVIERGSWKGWLRVEKQSAEAILMGDRIMFQIRLDRAEGELLRALIESSSLGSN